MSKEAMKLALEHAKRDERHLNHAETRYWCRMYRDIAEKAVEALAKPDFWEGYVPEPDKRQQALDKKAQNARELGLDYEPAQQEPVEVKQIAEALRQVGLTLVRTRGSFRVMDLGRIEAQTTSPPAQQEPVSFLDWYDNAHWGNEDFKEGCRRAWDAALKHTSPPAQRTWVGLTNEELSEVYNQADWDAVNGWEYERAIEAKLRSKNEDRN